MGGSWVKVAPENVDLSGKVSIVTGANTGIGFITVKELARRNAHVILACRSQQKAEAAKERIIKELSGTKNPEDIKIETMSLDLNSLKSIREFADSFKQKGLSLHLLINNAGIMLTPFQLTEDGFESQMGVNHLGHFYLTNLLLDVIKSSAPARIINLSSMAHVMGHLDFDNFLMNKSNYSSYRAYGNSKLANILFTRELAKRLEGTGVNTYAVHPGYVHTELGRHLTGASILSYFIARRPEQGAATTLWVALSQDPQVANSTGKYWADCGLKAPSVSQATDDDAAKKLWEISEQLVTSKASL